MRRVLALVRNPREQVADAEALLDITSTLVASVKSHTNDGVSPSDFTTALLCNFGHDRGSNADSARNTFSWSDAGLAISHAFREFPGSLTMVGPLESEMKQRKAAVHRKRTRPSESTCPEELENQQEVKTDTDKNMSTMFDVLRKTKRVRLENLVLNRASFAQSVENIFALSFLVKDGRAEISVNESGHHFVPPRNAPTATSVASGNVSFNHFVFKFDFKDWKKLRRNPRHKRRCSGSQQETSNKSRWRQWRGHNQAHARGGHRDKSGHRQGLIFEEVESSHSHFGAYCS